MTDSLRKKSGTWYLRWWPGSATSTCCALAPLLSTSETLSRTKQTEHTAMKIDLQIDIKGANALLKRIQGAGQNPSPVLKQTSELLVDSTKQRFATSAAPDGTRW